MNITLKKLVVKNFKGIKDMTIDPNGNDVRISGQNASGKTNNPAKRQKKNDRR